MSDRSSENMRREARVEVRVPVVFYRGRKMAMLETSDVSFKGLFVRTDEPPPLRALVKLKVGLLDREFEAHAMAVHVVPPHPTDGRRPGVGLQFWGLSSHDRAAWDEFVRSLVHARRGPVPRSDTLTPSGIRIVVTPRASSSK